MSEEKNTNQYPTDLIFATTVGLGLVCLVAKYRGSVVQRLKKIKGFTDPLSHQNAVVINTPTECENIVQKLKVRCAEFGVLGFDCEWVTVKGTRHKVALVQLAATDGLCALIRVSKLKHLPLDLKALLEDASVLKVGVAPSDDAKYLFHDYGVTVRGCLDLRHLLLQNGGKTKGGLAGLSESILGVKLDKSWHIRCSNWESDSLSERQINYAAQDALVGIEIFKVLVQGRLKRGLFSWSWKPVILNKPCRQFVDVRFKNKAYESYLESSAKVLTESRSQPVQKTVSRSYMTRRSAMYHNCYMQAPDGEVLCTCDKRKAEWYVTKNLATVLSEEPFTIRLKFEPAGRVVDEAGLFYTLAKENCCVVCGQKKSYLRKNIVPHSYRKHFPKVMKDHTSHDVLLMCLQCHLESNMHDAILRNKLAVECDAPIGTMSDVKYHYNPESRGVQMAAKALLSTVHKIPEERRKELERKVLAFYKDNSQVTPELLQKALKLDPSVPNSTYEPHGLKVVQYFSKQRSGGLIELERMWREHFLETMRPRFLPKLWSVTHNRLRLTQRAEENRVLAEDLNVAGLSDYTHLLSDRGNSEERASVS